MKHQNQNENHNTKRFETVNPLGNQVICTEKTWIGHVIDGHPEMEGREELVISALKDPDVIFNSDASPKRNVYFSGTDSGRPDRSLYIKVVTNLSQPSIEYVVSTWMQKKISGGISNEIYRKPKD